MSPVSAPCSTGSPGRWWWLAVAFGGVVAAYVGYFFAYRGLDRAERDARLDFASLLAVVTGGFGGFLAQ